MCTNVAGVVWWQGGGRVVVQSGVWPVQSGVGPKNPPVWELWGGVGSVGLTVRGKNLVVVGTNQPQITNNHNGNNAMNKPGNKTRSTWGGVGMWAWVNKVWGGNGWVKGVWWGVGWGLNRG